MDPAPLWKRLRDGWLAIVGRFGHVQTLVMLAFFYALLVGPVALAMYVGRADMLKKRGLRTGDSAWCDADSAEPDLERAKLAS